MASIFHQPNDSAVELTRIFAAIAFGLSCLSAVMVGGAFVGRALSEIMETTEIAPTEAINPLR